MILSYGDLLSPEPIKLSIGTLRKPTLREISQIGFDVFNTYEAFLKCTPKYYYTQILKNHGGMEHWSSLTEDEQESLTLYKMICSDKWLQEFYIRIFKFFFKENVFFRDEFFILFNGNEGLCPDIPQENICGIISGENFQQVIHLIQQICCVNNKTSESVDDMIFKNEFARKMYEKMQKALKEQEEQNTAKADKDMLIPNIISAVSANHLSLNPINIWDLTVFQLLDTFQRLQVRCVYEIDSTRVSVWGDEKNKFKQGSWYKNFHDA